MYSTIGQGGTLVQARSPSGCCNYCTRTLGPFSNWNSEGDGFISRRTWYYRRRQRQWRWRKMEVTTVTFRMAALTLLLLLSCSPPPLLLEGLGKEEEEEEGRVSCRADRTDKNKANRLLTSSSIVTSRHCTALHWCVHTLPHLLLLLLLLPYSNTHTHTEYMIRWCACCSWASSSPSSSFFILNVNHKRTGLRQSWSVTDGLADRPTDRPTTTAPTTHGYFGEPLTNDHRSLPPSFDPNKSINPSKEL